jgi:CpeS-like protein
MQLYLFFELNQGKWISQQTIYKIYTDEIYTCKSETIITADYKKITNQKPEENFLDTTFMIYLKNLNFTDQDIHSINILIPSLYWNNNLIQKNNFKNTSYSNTHINNIDHLTLKTIHGELISFEKIWFVNPNLRLSIGLIEKHDKCLITSFTSDIRIN